MLKVLKGRKDHGSAEIVSAVRGHNAQFDDWIYQPRALVAGIQHARAVEANNTAIRCWNVYGSYRRIDEFDEFYMVRAAGLTAVAAFISERSQDDLTPNEQLNAIRGKVAELFARSGRMPRTSFDGTECPASQSCRRRGTR